MRRKRAIRVGAFVLLIMMGLALPWLDAWRPSDTRELIKPPVSEWSGVISIGVVETWRPGASSFAAYAAQIARAFEKTHKGVLVAVREMEPITLQTALENGNAPDVVLFGSGALGDARGYLLPLSGDFSEIRREYLASGTADGMLYALPVAAGGYCVIVNKEVLPEAAGEPQIDWDEFFARMSAKGLTLQCPAPESALPAAGLIAATDGAVLGAGSAVAPNIAAVKRAFCWPDFVLENKYAAYLGTQYDVERLKLLRSSGRAFDSAVLPSAQSYTDQVQYAALTRPDRQTATDADAQGRLSAAGALLSEFMRSDSREALAALRVLPVDGGEPLYANIAGMDVLERSMAATIYVPNAFTCAAETDAAGSGLAGSAQRLIALGWAGGGDDGTTNASGGPLS